MPSVRPAGTPVQSAPTSRNQLNADQALALTSQFPSIGFHYTLDDYRALPKDAREVIDVLAQFANGATDRAGRLGLNGGRTHSEPSMNPEQTLAALAAIEKRTGKKSTTLLADAAASKKLTPEGREAMKDVSRLLRGGLEKQPGFEATKKLYAAKPLPAAPAPTLRERQEAEAAEAAWEAKARAANARGVDWNWARGNHPSQASTSLFVRK
jgi:hypothetical protein